MLVSKIAQFPNIINKLQNDFNFSVDQLRQIFPLPHPIVLESYVKGFQLKVLNSILYPTSKLHKIGFKTDDLCSFCKAEPETLYHPFCECSHVRNLWSEFQDYWYQISNQQVYLSLQDVLFGILTKPCPLLNLLNYFIIIGKLFIWVCRRCEIRPKIQGFRTKISIKYETESNINKKDFFKKKWVLIPK